MIEPRELERMVIHMSEQRGPSQAFADLLAKMPKGATPYRDQGFQGAAHLFTEGRYDASNMVGHRHTPSDTLRESLDNAVSSIKLDQGYKVTLYDSNDFSGASKTFTASVEYVGDDWQDKASSVVVEKV
jgi:hypothetical protein